jgi:plastocyanin
MRLCLFSALAVVALGIAMIGLLRASPAADRQPVAATPVYFVELRDNYFDPPGLFLQLNESVTWVLRETGSSLGHSATAYHPSQDKELRIPEQAQPFNSNVFKRLNDRFSFTFTVAGIYDYFCIPHEDVGMVGRVIVKEAIGPGTKSLDKGVSIAGQSMMPTVEEILALNGQIFNLLARLNSVSFFAQQNRRDQATAQLKLIQKDWTEGRNLPSSLYESLKSVQLEKDLTKQLGDIEETLSQNGPANTTYELVQRAKDTLNKAMSKLSQKDL